MGASGWICRKISSSIDDEDEFVTCTTRRAGVGGTGWRFAGLLSRRDASVSVGGASSEDNIDETTLRFGVDAERAGGRGAGLGYKKASSGEAEARDDKCAASLGFPGFVSLTGDTGDGRGFPINSTGEETGTADGGIGKSERIPPSEDELDRADSLLGGPDSRTSIECEVSGFFRATIIDDGGDEWFDSKRVYWIR